MSRGELPPTPLEHTKLWAAVLGVFASVCAAAHKPRVTTELTQLPPLISPEVRRTASRTEQALK